jgi:hypothetical protein
MVLAIAALFLNLHAVAAVSDPVSGPVSLPAAPIARSSETNGAANVSVSSPSAPAESEPLLASNTAPAATSLASLDGSTTQPSSDPSLSPSSFASVVRSSESLSVIRVATPESKALHYVEPESLPSRRKWLALALVEHSAATFDAYSTRRAIGLGAIECDPLMRPFAQSPAIYAAIQVAPVALDFAARRMQRSQNGFMRRTWWMPQTAAAGMFLFSGVHNLHVASRLQ